MQNTQPVAVSARDFNTYGCPSCGGIFGITPMSANGTAVWECADCRSSALLLADGMTRSTIGIGGDDDYPALQEHPRRGNPIDRDALIRARKQEILKHASDGLTQWLLLGHTNVANVEQVATHTSKSDTLPILSSHAGNNVQVSWFGYNYHSHFLGIQLDQPIAATLMYPISGIFGSYANSGHVNQNIAPPIKNFLTRYHTLDTVDRFGAECTRGGFTVSAVIRYLEQLSGRNRESILDTAVRKTGSGYVDSIDGNDIDFRDLAHATGIPVDAAGNVALPKNSVFEHIHIEWFETLLGCRQSAIHVTLKEGSHLPALPLPAEIYVDLYDTALSQHIPADLQTTPMTSPFDSHTVKKVSIGQLGYQNEAYREFRDIRERLGYEPHDLYAKVNSGTRTFILAVPNPLDAVLTALFLAEVVDPLVRDMTSM